MDTGTDGSEQLVMLQNETRHHLGARQDVTAFTRMSTGVYGSMPKLMARYTYDY